MVVLLVFAVVLLVTVLVSEYTERSVLSGAVLFLVAGFVLGPGVTDVLPLGLEESEDMVSVLAELALFAVLFTDGMRTGGRQLFTAWRLPGRALLLGMPLTLLFTALLAHYVADVPWLESFLLGSVLAPTDPVFAAAIVGRKEVPARLRHLLNVESGINDGLALPVVLVLLASLGGREEATAGSLATELALGLAIGIGVPWLATKLEGSRFLSTHTTYEPLSGVAIGVLVFALAQVSHGNLFLAAFAAGVTMATVAEDLSLAFHGFGELVAELLKLGALLVFGALLSPQFLSEVSISGYVFAFFALFAVRPAAIAISLWRSGLRRSERVVAGWFGPKGFASVVYGLLVLDAGIELGDELFHLAGIVIAGSMLAHSSTDVLVARWFERAAAEEEAGATAEQRRARAIAEAEAAAAEQQPPADHRPDPRT